MRTDAELFEATVEKIKEINKTRRMLGMSEIKIQMRPCMRCQKEFLSESIGHRLCSHCTTLSATGI